VRSRPTIIAAYKFERLTLAFHDVMNIWSSRQSRSGFQRKLRILVGAKNRRLRSDGERSQLPNVAAHARSAGADSKEGLRTL